MTRPDLADELLDLLLRPVDAAQAAQGWSAADWAEVARVGREHRLAPLLHWRLRDAPPSVAVPETLRTEFAEAFRRATLRALSLQGELASTVRRLRTAGIECIALKGAHLALAAYPHAALRPMRDLDLLVRPGDVARAFQCLRDAGYTLRPAGFTGDPAEFAAGRRHETPLRAPDSGVIVEIHGRLHEHDAMGRDDASADVPEALWTASRTLLMAGETVRVLCPTDLLLHLVVHGCYHHHFDNGPTLLADLAAVLAMEPLDVDRLRAAALAGGWTRGLQLLLHIVDRRLGTRHAEAVGGPLPPDVDAQARAAAALTTQEVALRHALRLTTSLDRSGGVVARLQTLRRKVFPSRAALGVLANVDPRSWRILPAYLQRWAHLARRGAEIAGVLRDDTLQASRRRHGQATRDLVAWLRPEEPRGSASS